MKVEKKSIAFLILGGLIALSLEQIGWWHLIITNPGKIHNDFWILISEDINTSQEGTRLNVLYSTDINQANLVFNIWEILFLISLFCLFALILWKR